MSTDHPVSFETQPDHLITLNAIIYPFDPARSPPRYAGHNEGPYARIEGIPGTHPRAVLPLEESPTN